MTQPSISIAKAAAVYLSRLADSPASAESLTPLRDALLYAMRCARAHCEDLASV